MAGSAPVDRTAPAAPDTRVHAAFPLSALTCLSVQRSGVVGPTDTGLGGDWQASATLQLGLRLENLMDKAYREHASGIDAPGRNAGLWLNYRF